MRLDRGFWVVAASATLALSGMSLLVCPTAHAGGPALAAVTVPTPPAGPAPTQAAHEVGVLASDDDGDELLEHWGDPKYSREERFQLAGMAVLLVGAGVGVVCRRRALRGRQAHG